jgi:serine/threonine-protein kinase
MNTPLPPKLGRYQLVGEIGKGAMGIVYRARDPMINREVALKAIPLAEEFDADELEDARTKFFREARWPGDSHPHIVTIYDAGEDGGTAYIAMELLRGTHLVEYTQAAKLLPSARDRVDGATRRRIALCAPEPGRASRHQAGE